MESWRSVQGVTMGFLFVSVPVRALSECLVTEPTLVWLLFVVNRRLMFVPMTSQFERFLTVSTIVGPLLEVDCLLVRVSVAASSERLFTMSSLVRFLFSTKL